MQSPNNKIMYNPGEHMRGDFYSQENALKYVDSFLNKAPQYDSFFFEKILSELDTDEMAKRLLHSDTTAFKTLMNDKLGYIERDPNHNQFWALTKLGRNVKLAGGHFSYLEREAENHNKTNAREKLADEKLQYDSLNAKRIYKTYWITFVLSILGVLLALGKIIYDIANK